MTSQRRRALIVTRRSRHRQAQRESGAQRRDKREAREFGFGVVMGFLPVEDAPALYP